MKQTNRKGFTLAELLIVVVIIAVLVAIAIPVFTTQLHNARASADMANVRAYYAELQMNYMETNEISNIYADEALLDTITYLDGSTTKLKEGKMFLRAFKNGQEGYFIAYSCNKGCANHDLLLDN